MSYISTTSKILALPWRGLCLGGYGKHSYMCVDRHGIMNPSSVVYLHECVCLCVIKVDMRT